MDNGQRPSLKDPNVIFLSFLGTGFSRYAPGTVGTLASLPLLYLIYWLNVSTLFFLCGLTLLTVLACYLAELAQQKYGLHDPGWIVIDETIGIALAWAFLIQYSWPHILAITILFRFFDIIKIWPASYFDSMNNGAGTILDDVVAGIFAGLTYLAGLWCLSNFIISS